MNTMDQAVQTQLKNIQTRTGRTLEELKTLINKSGLTKHGEIRDMLKRELGMGHGDANTLVHVALQSDAARTAAAKESTIGIHKFGPFEIAPEKGYLSLRRKRQFAMVGPPTNTRVEVGLNMKGITGTNRLETLPPGGMCNFKVKLTDAGQVDQELFDWIKHAYDSAG
jgi:hypothetical protein